MKVALAVAALALLGAAPAARPIYAGIPPYRYMGDNVAVTIYTTDVPRYCGAATPGYSILGCVRYTKDGTPLIVMLNPCLFPEEGYARIACHELGHVNGWGSQHEY